MTLRRILLQIISFAFAATAYAGPEGVTTDRYNVQIDLQNAYVGGLCIIKTDDTAVTASIVNEFGISLITFRYDKTRESMKIVDCVRHLNRSALRRILKRDFTNIINRYMLSEENRPINYINEKHNITYNLRPL